MKEDQELRVPRFPFVLYLLVSWVFIPRDPSRFARDEAAFWCLGVLPLLVGTIGILSPSLHNAGRFAWVVFGLGVFGALYAYGGVLLWLYE